MQMLDVVLTDCQVPVSPQLSYKSNNTYQDVIIVVFASWSPCSRTIVAGYHPTHRDSFGRFGPSKQTTTYDQGNDTNAGVG